jgi:hypothetical protein
VQAQDNRCSNGWCASMSWPARCATCCHAAAAGRLTDRAPYLSLVRPSPVVDALETEAADGTAA